MNEYRTSLVALLRVLSLFGCASLWACSGGNSGGSGGSGGPGGTPAGGTDPTPQSGTSAFVGDWAPITSNGQITCNGKTTSVPATTANLTWKASSTAGQIYTVQSVAGTDCNITAAVNGQVATGAPGQACTVSQSASCGTVTLTLSLSAYSFALSNGSMGHEDFSYTGQGNCGGVAVTCTVSGSGDFQKL